MDFRRDRVGEEAAKRRARSMGGRPKKKPKPVEEKVAEHPVAPFVPDWARDPSLLPLSPPGRRRANPGIR